MIRMHVNVYFQILVIFIFDFGWENRTKSLCNSGGFYITYTTSVLALISFVFSSWIINEYCMYYLQCIVTNILQWKYKKPSYINLIFINLNSISFFFLLSSGCRDKHEKCPTWGITQCKQNPVFMETECPLTCRVCSKF